MNPIVTEWSYLELDGDHVALRKRAMNVAGRVAARDGDYCGEWGALLGEHGRPVGLRLFFFLDYLPDHLITWARNCARHEDDLIVHVEDDRLPEIDGMPFLPVYRAKRPNGRDIFLLSGYDE